MSRRKKVRQRPQNALQAVQYLLSPEGELEMERYYNTMERNPYVLGLGLVPTYDQFVEYFRWLRDGMKLARRELGDECLPREVRLYYDKLFDGTHFVMNFVGYLTPPRDQFVIGIARVVQDSFVSSPEELVRHISLPYKVFARARVMLIALEECFHRYQWCVLGRRGGNTSRATDPDDPIEQEAQAFLERLITERKIIVRSE